MILNKKKLLKIKKIISDKYDKLVLLYKKNKKIKEKYIFFVKNTRNAKKNML